jgi:hypothetical protein
MGFSDTGFDSDRHRGDIASIPQNLPGLFLASLATLYFELLVIRYASTEIRAFANLKNMPLIASFFGIGLGMLLGKPTQRRLVAFPLVGSIIFLSLRYAGWLHLSAVDLSWNISPNGTTALWRTIYAARFATIVLSFSALVVFFFSVLGAFVGRYFGGPTPLKSYGVNLAGSFTGMVLFSALSFCRAGPGIWLLLGFVLLVPFFLRQPVALFVFATTVCFVAIPEAHTQWSPYYKIEFVSLPPPAGSSRTSAYSLVSNHVWYQWAADLSPGFLTQYPEARPNRFLVPYYEIPYRLVPHPENVLILGAGTGNDVAAALRHGARHVDAVELDPVILGLGEQYHPEHPYSSSDVVTHLDDARDFLRRTKTKYDLVVFAFLDSSTLLSSFSSLRLDNYVYTVQGFESARHVLADNGTLLLSFATGRSFPTDRMFATLEKAFGSPPSAYLTQYWVNGVLMVEGGARDIRIPELADVGGELAARSSRAILATDDWPFLYLENRSIPDAIVVVGAMFLLGVWVVLRRTKLIAWKRTPYFWHFFFLGAGFLLLETRAITSLSLLFGSTWVVNAVVIASFLLLSMLSNMVAGVWNVPPAAGYGALLLLLVGAVLFPLSPAGNTNSWIWSILASFWVALPAFFAGLVFSTGFKRVNFPAQVLGINLFGAVCGGLLENAVMVGGTRSLGWLAMFLYTCSAICLLRSRSKVGDALTA